MKKVTYWVARCLDDSEAYSLRERTRAECESARRALYESDGRRYGKPFKHTIEGNDTLDIVRACLSEGRGFEYAPGVVNMDSAIQRMSREQYERHINLKLEAE